MRHLVFAVAAAALVLAACGQPDTAPAPVAAEPETPAAPARLEIDTAALGIPTDADSISDGRNIAIDHCAICHGIDNADALRDDAPALRYVLSLYPPESLAEDFRYGIHVGHEDMPDFVFGDLGMDVLLSYLVSIQEAPPAE
jgi:mono/diheme cytochrome c family protein